MSLFCLIQQLLIHIQQLLMNISMTCPIIQIFLALKLELKSRLKIFKYIPCTRCSVSWVIPFLKYLFLHKRLQIIWTVLSYIDKGTYILFANYDDMLAFLWHHVINIICRNPATTRWWILQKVFFGSFFQCEDSIQLKLMQNNCGKIIMY
jgi:hypothetical protein